MSKQSTTRQAARPATPPPLTDPHLTALLLYISGSDGTQDDDGQQAAAFARSVDATHRLLTSIPITSAFGLWINRPEVNEEVSACLRAGLPDSTDPEDGRRAFDMVHAALRDDEGPETISAEDVRNVLPSYIDSSVQLGACLMYELLTTGRER